MTLAGPAEWDRTPTEDGSREPRTVVVVDTDPGVLWALERGLQREGYVVYAANTVGEAIVLGGKHAIHAVLVELLPEAGVTFEVIGVLTALPGSPRVICTSVEADPQNVIECMRRGAADFIPKPFGMVEVRQALRRAIGGRETVRVRLKPGSPGWGQSEPSLLIGISPEMQELREVIKRVAQTDLNCLIRGESGTGKDLVARDVHRLSRRHDRPFVKVNCTALPEQLLESELFGYEKGAFTGAVTSKPGRFEIANNGIVFMDEIGDMHPGLQSKLLQVIEHKEFTKLGGRRHIQVDVQIIAATNADLEKKTQDGTFRDDLYFRLNEVCIWVPPLSERKEDIPLLVKHFMRKHGRYPGQAPFEISGEDLANLTDHEWPGNVRELESTIKRWLALGRKALPGRTPRTPDVHAAASETLPVEAINPAHKNAEQPPPMDSRPEKLRIIEALEENQWNRRKAALTLGIGYQTLRRRIEKYGLDRRR